MKHAEGRGTAGAWGVGPLSARAREVAQRKEAFPEEPWRWRADWDRKILEASPPELLPLKWLTSLALVVVMTLLLANRYQAPQDSAPTYFLLAIPVLCVLVCSLTTYTTIRWLLYRDSYCRLDTLPGEIGGEFRADIFPEGCKEPRGPFRVRLACSHYQRIKWGGKRRTRTRVRWTHDSDFSKEQINSGPDIPLVIPVRVAIPATCLESTPSMASDRIEWELTVHAATSGIDYYASFIVPVFRTVSPERRDLSIPISFQADEHKKAGQP